MSADVVVVVLASVALAAIGLARLSYWRSRPSSRPLTLVVLAMAVATAVRLPGVADSVVDPWLHGMLGIHNATELVAAVAGVFAFMTVVELVVVTVSEQPMIWRRIFAVGTFLVLGATIVGFLASPAGGEPSDAIFRDFPLDRGLAVFWGLYVGTMVAASTGALFYLVRMVRLPGVRLSPLGRPLLLMTAGAIAGLLPASNLLFRLRMHSGGTPDWYRAHAELIGWTGALVPLCFIGAGALFYSVTALPDRVRRYRAIRRSSDRYAEVLRSGDDVMAPRDARTYSTRSAAWWGSRSPMITHQMMVVLADAAVRSGDGGRPQAASV